MAEKMATARMGDPLDPSTTLGPLARMDLRDELHRQVTVSVAAGARLTLGGIVPAGPGAFYPPTVLTEVKAGMAVYSEETFGPVATIIPVIDEDEAVMVANDSQFGLGAAVFSRDVERAEHIAATRLEAGCCFVNALVASDPRLPFGGIKTSGYGRELSDLGIREFVNEKTVVVA
jgi:succinate-semialdehyde dehydrogenase/glutarate-semialdehyde dehydrogenase